jgi:kumamolisin
VPTLAGSHKHPSRDFDQLDKIAPEEEFRISVRVRGRSGLPKVTRHKRRTHAELAQNHGAHKTNLDKVAAFARDNGLIVHATDPQQRRVVLEGRASAFQRAFGVDLRTAMHQGRRCRVRQGGITIPAQLRHVITSVTGLDNRPFAKPHIRIGREAARAVGATGGAAAFSPAAPAVAFTPLEVAELYNFPAGLDGTGQTIAILELGGGFHDAELETYFQGLGIARPHVRVACGQNNPGTNALDPFCVDTEVMLDIQIAGAVAPGASIVVYFTPDDSDESFLSGMAAMVHDTVNKPSVISISWGAPEEIATAQFRAEFDRLLQEAAHLGITVCVATGDNGSANFAAHDSRWDQNAHLDFPASSPYALACGGTKISTADGKIVHEEAWYDGLNDGTGGGVSRVFPLPDYQALAGIPRALDPEGPVMRGTPDVAGNASPLSGYRILCSGQNFPDTIQGIPAIGGTSAVAPLWAGLIALVNQALGRSVGFVNPALYEIARTTGAFRDITIGTNGSYRAANGWDACTGLGVPDGAKLLEALRALPGDRKARSRNGS